MIDWRKLCQEVMHQAWLSEGTDFTQHIDLSDDERIALDEAFEERYEEYMKGVKNNG